MYKDILRAIVGVEIFPVISLLLFVTVFTAVVVYVMRLERPRIERQAQLPLDDDGTCRGCGKCGGPGTCGKEAAR
jgi:cytochrome c oxidase cbb3-type subunit IV